MLLGRAGRRFSRDEGWARGGWTRGLGRRSSTCVLGIHGIEPAVQCTGEAVGKPSHERNGGLGRTSLNQPYAALSGFKRPDPFSHQIENELPF